MLARMATVTDGSLMSSPGTCRPILRPRRRTTGDQLVDIDRARPRWPPLSKVISEPLGDWCEGLHDLGEQQFDIGCLMGIATPAAYRFGIRRS